MILLRVCHFCPCGCTLKTIFFPQHLNRTLQEIFPLFLLDDVFERFLENDNKIFMLFIANYRDDIGLQENCFLKYPYIPLIITLCLEEPNFT